MVIGPLHTPRLGVKCGEVKPDSFTCSHFLGIFARYQSRPRLPLREEDRTMALHLGGSPSGTGPACLLWLRLLGHLAFLEKLVCYGRLRIRPIQFQLRSGWFQNRDHPLIQVNLDQGTRDSILWWRTHSSLHKGIPLVSPLIEVFLFTDSSAVGWGAHMDKRTTSARWSEAMKSCTSMCWN